MQPVTRAETNSCDLAGTVVHAAHYLTVNTHILVGVHNLLQLCVRLVVVGICECMLREKKHEKVSERVRVLHTHREDFLC